MIFGMPTLAEFSSLTENLELCRELGLSFVELNMNFPEYQSEALRDTDRLLRMADQAGAFYTIHLDENLDPAAVNPRVRTAWTETALEAIRAACSLGAPLVNLHLNHGVYITLPDRRLFIYDRDRKEYLDHMRTFRDQCEAQSRGRVRVALENTDGFREVEQEAVELMLESPVFGLTWDIGHSCSAQEKDLPFLEKHADRLIHFHIHDGSQEPRRNHLALGNGEIDLNARLLTARDHGCRCVLETKTAKALLQSVKYLKEKGWIK